MKDVFASSYVIIFSIVMKALVHSEEGFDWYVWESKTARTVIADTSTLSSN